MELMVIMYANKNHRSGSVMITYCNHSSTTRNLTRITTLHPEKECGRLESCGANDGVVET